MSARARFTGTAVLLLRDDIDTDQIVPARFLTVTDRSGLDTALFADKRTEPDFPLNAPGAASAAFLVAGRNFGCGSSREHAVWALRAFGFRAVIAPSFADIFRRNALENGLLPIVVGPATHERIGELCSRAGNCLMAVDLTGPMLTLADGTRVPFDVDPFARRCLLDGTDALGMLLAHDADIARYEEVHPTLHTPPSTLHRGSGASR
jgi:3-isopropylmalate/(R)-2-methylmalate dehydratase small subunit